MALIASGFSEIGESELEGELVSVARANGIRVIGPNCLRVGYLNDLRIPYAMDQEQCEDDQECVGLRSSFARQKD